jgi:hypothetical protein
LLEKNKELIKDSTYQLYDTIDTFYNIYYDCAAKNKKLTYLDRGILSFNILLYPEFKMNIPLDIIFKQIHATEKIPFIKYNPGKRRDSIFRLYSKLNSTDGKKIPYLPKNKIISISNENKKQNQITLMIFLSEKNTSLFMDIEENGNIRIRSELNNAISEEELVTIIKKTVNPILQDINNFLEKSGYEMKGFNNITDENVEIININYKCLINVSKPVLFKKIVGCLTVLFDITNMDMDLSKGLLFNYTRVDNYQKMNAISAVITEIFKNTNNKDEIIDALVINFGLSKEEALQKIIDYFNDHTRIQGKYVNKQLDIVDNPGFPVSIFKTPFDNKLLIRINRINSIEFIDLLNIYFDTIIRIFESPEDIRPDLMNKINSCSIRNKIEEAQVNNVITNAAETTILPIEFDEADEEDKYLPDDEDEEEPYLPDDDENEREDEVIKQNVDKEQVDDDDEEDAYLPDEEDAYLPDEDDEAEYEHEETETVNRRGEGGGGKKKDSDTSSKANIFSKRLKEREPNLILTEQKGKFVEYSRICPANISMQPVILTDNEKKKIDESHSGSYTNAIKYGTDPKNPYWYICPRYWCLQNNMPMTEEEVARGDCGGKVIPNKAKTPPPGHFIVQFDDPKYHYDKDGKYIYHSPGFKKADSHPDGYCLPCCFNKWAAGKMVNGQWVEDKTKNQQQKRRDACGLKDYSVGITGPDDKPKFEARQPEVLQMGDKIKERIQQEKQVLLEKENEKAVEKQKKTLNVFGVERHPIPHYRWGFLPIAVEKMLRTSNSKYVRKNNTAYIRLHERPLLRYGIEESMHQSFIGAISDVYSSYKKKNLLSISDMRREICNLLDLDTYLKLHHGSLVSIFRPSKLRNDYVSIKQIFYDDSQSENEKRELYESKIEKSEFYKSIRVDNIAQKNFLNDTISSFHNFLLYLNDKDSMIDHTYLWDLVSSEESPLFEGGLNLVIMEIKNNDITDNIGILCPTNSYSDKIYIKERGTILLLKHGEYYEPIYQYGDTDKTSLKDPIKIFDNSEKTKEMKEIQKIFTMIMNVSGKCRPIRSRPSPNVYKFKENISAQQMAEFLKSINYVIHQQVMNYNGKIIGLMVSKDKNSKIFLPTFPSIQLMKIDTIYMDDIEWTNYDSTVKLLTMIYNDSGNQIFCKPMMKIVEDGLIVGVLTETNQFVKLSQPAQNTEDGMTIMNSSGYSDLDTVVATSKNEDNKRRSTILNISLETQFYISFRNMIRESLKNYANREIRKRIIDIIEDHRFLYNVKLQKLKILLLHLTRHYRNFVDDIDSEIKNKLDDVTNCTATNCDIKQFCLMRNNKYCFPKKNLINGSDNETFYFIRIADELVRYTRIRLFLLEPNKYLNITNVNYKINADEILILSSVLNSDYFDNLVPFQQNKYVQNITYDIATPSKNTNYYQNFTNDVPIDEQK